MNQMEIRVEELLIFKWYSYSIGEGTLVKTAVDSVMDPLDSKTKVSYITYIAQTHPVFIFGSN